MRWWQQNEQKRTSGEDSASWFSGNARASHPHLQCFVVRRPVFFANGQVARSGVCSTITLQLEISSDTTGAPSDGFKLIVLRLNLNPLIVLRLNLNPMATFPPGSKSCQFGCAFRIQTVRKSIIGKLSKAKSSKAKFPGKLGIIFAAKHVLARHCLTGRPCGL